ncbi:MAG: Trk system potassium transporter TrkA [Bacilli bacterium]|nr:Trk system potassium transporter TrkA [Bacilli bacterium]
MRIVIVGIGKLGEYLTRQLVDLDNEVTIVDKDFSRKTDIINNLDVNYIEGNGLDSNVLLEAGVSNSDLLISVMNKDEANLMCSLIGKKLGAKHTIARIRTPEYSNSINLLKDDLGLSMTINPEAMTASSIARTLNIPRVLDSTTFLKGRIEVVTLKVVEKSKLIGASVETFSKKLGINMIICAIERGKDTIIPKSNTKILLGDKIHITGTRRDINTLLKYLGLTEKTKYVMIAGGSSVAVYLSRMLIDMGMKVKIIELERDRCLELNEAVPKAIVVNGDVSDQEILYEEDIENCDAFIALTSIDEENIIYSMFAKNLGVKKVITKVNHIKLDGVIDTANIDTVIAPHKVATNMVVKYVREMANSGDSSCEAIYNHDNIFEMIEYKVGSEFKKIGVKIKDLKLKNGIIIAAVQREKNIIFPNGDDLILNNDTIVVVNSKNRLKSVNDILE